MTKYLAAAAREFYDGQIDQPLWLRAVQKSGADEGAARAAYIRARAAAMRVARHDPPSRHNGLVEPTVSHSRSARRSENSSRTRRAYRTWRINRTALIVIALAIGVPAAGIVGYSLAPQATGASAAPAPSGNSAQTRLLESAKSAVTKARAAERPNVSGDDLARKVQELKDSGNWNVMVLYATEWTRKLPASPDAWNELSMGYVKLRQFNDALEAASKAVQLAPENPHAWQNLGEVNVALQLPAAALTAYERAVELNARDVTSLVQVGLLNAQLGQPAQARAAFGKALDVNPLDADALCGAATTAQKDGRAKDADAYVRQLKSASLQCRTAGASEPVSVTAASAAKKKP
jgi:tetratricopeptide (TPR) repeat protein